MPEQQIYLTPDMAPRLAAIDIGSNSIRLVVAEGQPNGRYRILDEERETTRLGRSLATTNRLDDQSIDDTLAALRRFQSIAAGLNVENLRAIATCAIREAENGPQFCQLAADQLGLAIEVISAEKEALLSFQSVRRRFDLTGKNAILADIGGGSTEIIVATGELIEAVYATPLGAVRIGEKFGGAQILAGDDYDRMIKWIDRELREATEKPPLPLHLLIGSGGTFTSLASMVMASRGHADLPAAGCQVSHADVRHLVDRLRKMAPNKRRETPGLNPDRVDIIVPGLAVIDRLMRRFRVNVLQVHAYGVRDGLLLSMFERLQGGGGQGPPSAELQIARFAEACGVNPVHASHIAGLARQIYSGLVAPFGLDPHDVRLLDAAARLQDVGYLISYEKHHKHSYHLILHSRLEAYRPEELEIIANVARYHRGGEPKQKHPNFRRLSLNDRLRVRRLAGILRIAGGLDRSHNQTVRAVRVEADAQRVRLLVDAAEYPEVDLWAAQRRTGLFAKAFGVEATVDWNAHATQDAS